MQDIETLHFVFASKPGPYQEAVEIHNAIELQLTALHWTNNIQNPIALN